MIDRDQERFLAELLSIDKSLMILKLSVELREYGCDHYFTPDSLVYIVEDIYEAAIVDKLEFISENGYHIDSIIDYYRELPVSEFSKIGVTGDIRFNLIHGTGFSLVRGEPRLIEKDGDRATTWDEISTILEGGINV
jgi:hypothetical protein